MKFLVYALILGLGINTAYAEQLQCQLSNDRALIWLNLQLPKVIHEVKGQKVQITSGTKSKTGVLNYKLADATTYQLIYPKMVYTKTLIGKPVIYGFCRPVVRSSKPVVPTPLKPSTPPSFIAIPPQFAVPAIPNHAGFACGKKRYCKQMVSCQEATYYMKQCGLMKLDSDADGKPCENVCGKR